MKITNTDIVNLLYSVALPGTYNPPTYTCIKEFTDSFPQKCITDVVVPAPDIKPVWQLEEPYPRIYTKDYKKTLLSANV